MTSSRDGRDGADGLVSKASEHSEPEQTRPITSIWPNYNADIDERLLENTDNVQLNNICWCCGNMTLYVKPTQLGPYIACASVGCEGSLDTLLKRAFKHREAYYKQLRVTTATSPDVKPERTC